MFDEGNYSDEQSFPCACGGDIKEVSKGAGVWQCNKCLTSRCSNVAAEIDKDASRIKSEMQKAADRYGISPLSPQLPWIHDPKVNIADYFTETLEITASERQALHYLISSAENDSKRDAGRVECHDAIQSLKTKLRNLEIKSYKLP